MSDKKLTALEIFRWVYKSSSKRFSSAILNYMSIIFSLILALGLTISNPLLKRYINRRIFIFELSALGHSVLDFIEFVRHARLEQFSQKVYLLYRYSYKNPTNNSFVFEIWGRRLESFPHVQIRNTPSLIWNALIYYSKLTKTSNSWLIPLSTQYAAGRSLEKTEVFSLIKHDEQSHLERLIKQQFSFNSNRYCILGVRDSGYYRDTSIRSTNWENYIPSVQFLLDQEIPVVRMGRRVNHPLTIKHELFFDYAVSDLTNDRNDILLFINAEFAIGDSYGLTTAIAAFGSPVLMATHSLDPRSFLSDPNIYFATQSLFTNNGVKLSLRDVVQIMNDNYNLGDEKVLNALGLISIPNSPEEIKSSVSWFLDVAVKKNSIRIDETNQEQSRLTNYLANHDLDKFKHYRRDALYSSSWQTMQSHIWPQSVRALFNS